MGNKYILINTRNLLPIAILKQPLDILIQHPSYHSHNEYLKSI